MMIPRWGMSEQCQRMVAPQCRHSSGAGGGNGSTSAAGISKPWASSMRARSLREDHRFAGYIHLKTIPDAAPELLDRKSVV